MAAQADGPGGGSEVTPAGVRPALPPTGARVVVRYRLTVPDPPTGATQTDVVGELRFVTDREITVDARRGTVRVARADIVAIKEVPPSPSRRAAAHRALSVQDLEQVMVGAWPAGDTARLGGWLLRATGGFTHRANSVLALGDPGLPLDDAVRHAERWYHDRGLGPMFTVASRLDERPATGPLGVILAQRGYSPRVTTRVLTAPALLEPPGASSGAGPHIDLSPTLTADWLEAFGSYREVDESAARRILTGSPEQVFATAWSGRAVIGTGRLGISAGWGGIAAMWVHPGFRRRGVATQALRALAAEARRRGIRSLHLQVDADNRDAIATYERHGFEPHHHYTTVRAPGPG
jgi:N-acetylglutamate synthase